ncbi:MAG: MIP/aquaporin family protein [Pseudomonadota bacterium]
MDSETDQTQKQDRPHPRLKPAAEKLADPAMNEQVPVRALFAEALGTAFLLATIVGSGIMADLLSNGNIGVALIGSTIAIGAILVVLIIIFGPVSGAHFNPAVSLVFMLKGEVSSRLMILYIIAQIVGAIVGVVLANMMFDLPAVTISDTARSGFGQITGEFVATFGLILTIIGCIRAKPEAVPYAVGLYISAGIWFTSSTAFANPAVTIGRMLSDTLAGINPINVPGFILAQFIGACLALITAKALFEQNK